MTFKARSISYEIAPQPSGNTNTDDSLAKVFVCSLPTGIPLKQLESLLFRHFSTKLSVKQVTVYLTDGGRKPAFGYVDLAPPSTPEQAIRLFHRSRFEGRDIKVREYNAGYVAKEQKCYQCGQTGHLARHCPLRMSDNKATSFASKETQLNDSRKCVSPRSRENSPSVSRSRSRSVKKRLQSSSCESNGSDLSISADSHSSAASTSSLSSSMAERIRSMPVKQRFRPSLDHFVWAESSVESQEYYQ